MKKSFSCFASKSAALALSTLGMLAVGCGRQDALSPSSQTAASSGEKRFALARCASPVKELGGHLVIALDIVMAPNGKAGAIQQVATENRRGFTLDVLNSKKNKDGSITLDVKTTQGDGNGGNVSRVHLDAAKKAVAIRWTFEGAHTTERVESYAGCEVSNLGLLQ